MEPQGEARAARPDEPVLIDEDPYGPSYPDSAIQHLSYRIGILVIAVFMIILGKSNLPSNSVPCIEDALLDAMQPLTDLYIANEGLGLAMVSLMQLLVDFQLVGGLAWWFLKGSSMRYPLLLAVVGISKILLNILFQTKLIDHSFTLQAFPSLVFGSNFQNTYFFSGVVCLLMGNLLELYETGLKKLFIGQLGVLGYVTFMLLSTRQNFFMDVTTALVFTHYTFYFINDRIKSIDRWTFALSDKLTPHQQHTQSSL